MTLTVNTNAWDRAARFSLGVLLLGLGAYIPYVDHWFFLAAPVVGLVLTAVAITGYCPLFAVLGFNENKGCETVQE